MGSEVNLNKFTSRCKYFDNIFIRIGFVHKGPFNIYMRGEGGELGNKGLVQILHVIRVVVVVVITPGMGSREVGGEKGRAYNFFNCCQIKAQLPFRKKLQKHSTRLEQKQNKKFPEISMARW